MKLFISLLIAFIIIGCSSSEQMTTRGDQKKSNQYDESFDPNSLNDDDIVIHKIDAGSVSPVKNNTSTSAVTGQPEYREVRGFRVQLIATKSIETATLAEQEAKDLFESLNHKTYLIFDAPFYKLRVGDYRVIGNIIHGSNYCFRVC